MTIFFLCAKPKIMDMMYEYEGYDGWWGNSDEDGLDAKQFALNWPAFRNMTTNKDE